MTLKRSFPKSGEHLVCTWYQLHSVFYLCNGDRCMQGVCFPLFCFLFLFSFFHFLPSLLPYLVSCLLAYLLTCLLACLLPSFLPSFRPSFRPSFLPSYLPTYLPTFLFSLLACLLAYLLTYLLNISQVGGRLVLVITWLSTVSNLFCEEKVHGITLICCDQ